MKDRKSQKFKGLMKGSCLWGILLFLVLLFIDMTTKMVADAYFSRPDAPESIEVIPELIYLTISYNRGIAFGVASDSSVTLKLAIIVGTGVMMAGLAVAYFLTDKRRDVIRTALVMIFSGGVGNLIDRVYYRVWDPTTATGVADGVRDMVDLRAFGLAVCNFADFFIVIGAIVLLLGFIFFDKDAIVPVGKYKKLAEAEEAEKADKKAEPQPKEEETEGQPKPNEEQKD